MASTSKCSIGVYLTEQCHKTIYNSQIGSRHIDMFAEKDQLLIKLRSGIDQPLTDICDHHETYFLAKYAIFQYKCCDLFLVHKKPCKGDEIILLSPGNFSLTVSYFLHLFLKSIFDWCGRLLLVIGYFFVKFCKQTSCKYYIYI